MTRLAENRTVARAGLTSEIDSDRVGLSYKKDSKKAAAEAENPQSF